MGRKKEVKGQREAANLLRLCGPALGGAFILNEMETTKY